MDRAPLHVVDLLRQADRIARASDRIIGFGPFNFGLDALAGLLPFTGPVYTIGAGVLILGLAHRAEVSRKTMLEMCAYIGVDALASGVPVLGSAVDVLVPGHIMAVKVMRKDLERKHGPLDLGGKRSAHWSRFADRFNPAGRRAAA